MEEGQSCNRTYTIIPINGMEAIQKNFASYGMDGDLAAEEFMQQKKLTLARRFKLIERGYALVFKEDCRKTWFDKIKVQISFGEKNARTKDDSIESSNNDKNSD